MDVIGAFATNSFNLAAAKIETMGTVHSAWLRYGIAVLAVAQALVLKFLLDPLIASEQSFVIFFVAVAASAGYGGLGPGLLASTLATLASVYFFIPPLYSFAVRWDEVVGIVIFVLLGLLVSVVAAAHQRAEFVLKARLRQQAAVAQFGQQALAGTNVSRLMDEAVSLIAQTLEVEYSKILERLPGGNALLLSAGVGWQPGVVGHLTLGVERQSHAGYTLMVNKPVITKDLRTETRFEIPSFFQEHQVISSVSVIIQGEGQPFGVLSACTIRRRMFTQDDINFLQAIANALAEAINRQRKEEELRQSEERFRVLVESAKDYAIFMLDMEGRVASWNAGAERVLGYQAAEILGQPSSIFFIPEDVQKREPEKERHKALTDGRAEDDRWHVRKNGSQFWATGLVTPLDAGQFCGFVKVMRDITERKQVEEQLRLQNRAMAEALSAIVITDPNQPDNPIIYCNPAFERMSGYSQQESLGRNCRFLQGPDTDQAVRAEIREAVAAGRGCRVVIENYRKDGSPFWNELAIAPVRDDTGRLTHFIGVKTDISDRKQVEIEREQLLKAEQEARSKAETVNQIKDEFLATLSHELRTPLNAMLGWVQLLRTRKLSSEVTARALETIERNAKAQAQLIEDLLDISRIIRGKFKLQLYPCDFSAVVTSAIDTVRPTAEAKAIELRVWTGFGVEPDQVETVELNDLDATLQSSTPSSPQSHPQFLVSGDPDRLQQVVWNLLSNAIKFTPKGGRVEVRLLQATSSIQLRVSDTGKGISAEFLPYVFERFRQADSTSTRAYGGLGLGLAIVRYLIELHGGTVQAESAGENKGATFTIRLPLAAGRSSVSSQSQTSAISEPVLNGSSPLHNLRVLVVDDEADAREIVNAVFEQYGAQVTAVASAGQAIVALDQRQPDILICDIGMPEEDGYTLIQKVRARLADQGGKMPAIALTAYAREEDRDRALAAGFQMHMAKPVNPDQLVAVVNSLSGKQSLGGGRK